jgi:hypothetical protein
VQILNSRAALARTELHILHHGVARIKSWAKAGILNSHKANDKNERLNQPPIAGDPCLPVRQGSPLRKRVRTQPTPGGAL